VHCGNLDRRKAEMKYTLITAKGKVYTFYVLAVAQTYQQAYGGNIVTNDILVDKIAQTVL
jgi:hypothetical protein